MVAGTHIRCSASGKAVRLTVDPVEGRFENMPASREWTFCVQLAKKPARVLLNGATVKDWSWADGMLTVKAASQPVSASLVLDIR